MLAQSSNVVFVQFRDVVFLWSTKGFFVLVRERWSPILGQVGSRIKVESAVHPVLPV